MHWKKYPKLFFKSKGSVLIVPILLAVIHLNVCYFTSNLFCI